jgi:cell wall-associated NlpC family hydrolase
LIELQKQFKDEAIVWVKNSVRYVHRGTSKLGCDCTGLIIGIARSIGYLGNYKLRMYPIDWNLHSGAGNYIIEELERVANEIPVSETQEGDIIIFKFAKCYAHVGILINKDNGKFAHSHMKARRCEFGFAKDSGWSRRWKKSYRLDPNKMKGFK